MKLLLKNGYPFPWNDYSEAQQEQHAADAGSVQLELEGVTDMEWLHEFTVRFESEEAMEKAIALTGWERWGVHYILRAPTSKEEGYGHPAIIAKSEQYGPTAFCGFFIHDFRI